MRIATRVARHAWLGYVTDARAKLIFYSAFVEARLDAPKSLLPEVHRLYFELQYAEFSPQTMWSLSNAFTSAFKELDPVPQFKATAKWVSSWRFSSRRPFSKEWRYRPDRRSLLLLLCRRRSADVGFADSLISHKSVYGQSPDSRRSENWCLARR